MGGNWNQPQFLFDGCLPWETLSGTAEYLIGKAPEFAAFVIRELQFVSVGTDTSIRETSPTTRPSCGDER